MGPMPAASPLPDPETIRRTAEQVLRRPDYQLDPQPDSERHPSRIAAAHFPLRFSTPFLWLLGALAGLPGWLRWPIVLGLAAILILLVLHIGYIRSSGPFVGPGGRAAAWPPPFRVRRATRPRWNSRRARRFLAATSSPPSGCCSRRACCGWSWRRNAPFAPAQPTANTCAGTRIRRSSSLSGCSSRSSRRGGTAGEYAGAKTSKPAGAAHARIRDFAQEPPHAQPRVISWH